MILVKRFSGEDVALWNDFNASAKNGFFLFDRGYMEYHGDRFSDESLLFFDDDELVAVLPASRHDDQLRSHGGLTFGGFVYGVKMKQRRMLECFDALCQYVRERGISRIVYKVVPYIYNLSPAQEDLYALWRQGAILSKRDVSSTIDLRSPIKMPKGRKAQISRARREGVVISDSCDYDAFITLENAVLQSRHGAMAVHSAKELALLASRFPQNIRLVQAKKDDELLAAAVLFVYPNLVHTQYMANSDYGCEIGALDLLVSEQLTLYTGQKDYFDLGTSMGDSSTGLNEGLVSQKEGFGGRAVMYDTYELAFNM